MSTIFVKERLMRERLKKVDIGIRDLYYFERLTRERLKNDHIKLHQNINILFFKYEYLTVNIFISMKVNTEINTKKKII